MYSVRSISIVVAALALAVILCQRRRVFALTCTGLFFVTHMVFVLIGLLLAPWLIEGIYRDSYSYVDWDLVTDRDLCLTIIVVAGGMGLALLGNIWAQTFGIRRAGAPAWGLLSSEPMSAGVSVTRLRLVSSFFLAVAVAVAAAHWSVLSQSMSLAYFHGSAAAFYEARIDIGRIGFFYFILVFNVLPFLAALQWMLYRRAPTMANRVWAWGMALATCWFLLATFQKRPLVLFVCWLLSAHVIAEASMGRISLEVLSRIGERARRLRRRLPWGRLIIALAAPVVVLVWLFSVSTATLGQEGSLADALANLSMKMLDRVISRLSIMPIFYVHCFPDVAPHYGLSNIGKLAALLGTEVFSDTIVVVEHFVPNVQAGSGAIGAIVDFYAAFGWVGWAIGCFAVGACLNFLDRCLARLPRTALNRAFQLSMLIFAYYLSQATVARSLSSYGGLSFAALFVVLRHPVVDRNPSPLPPSPQSRHIQEFQQ